MIKKNSGLECLPLTTVAARSDVSTGEALPTSDGK
jgi:hypothetical protein